MVCAGDGPPALREMSCSHHFALHSHCRQPFRPPAPQDPGNLEADIQAGAQTGFALLWWFALVSLGCGTAFQVGSAPRGGSVPCCTCC